jgi:hypothetical protein
MSAPLLNLSNRRTVCARLNSATRTAIVGALLVAATASPAPSQMLGLRAAAVTRSPKNIIANAIQEASRRFHVPAVWTRAVMRAESHGDANSVSEKGAIGLMQVMPKTYAELRTRLGLGPDPFDPHDNIMAGAAYLADMFERYGETGFLAAYNAGPRRYEEYLRGRPLPDETTDYVARLTSTLSLANVPSTQVPTSSDTLHAPIFVSFAALKLARKPSADGSVNSNSKSEKAAPHPLFPARRDDQIFAHHPPSNGAAEATLHAVPLRTANHFVARQVLESTR